MLSAALIVCAVLSAKSSKAIGKAVAILDLSFIPPIIGNVIIIGSHVETISKVGYYLYFIGMDVVIYALLHFTVEYCSGSGKEHRIPRIFFLLLALDTVQIILNIPFGHAFDVEATDVQGKIYYRLLPHFGQTIHRVMGYSIFAAVILIFIVVIRKMPRIYRERYTVILLSMIVVVLWQAFYIFSRTPVDRSMIGFGCFGLLAFYFAICYRPLRLLDRMLSNIAAGLGEALFAFDPNRKCIWANEPAEKLLDIKNDELDSVPEKLRSKFGVLDFSKTRQSYNVTLGSGDDASYFYLEKRPVYDNSGKDSGSFLVVRNNTEEQRRMKRELYNSTHDSLTGLYTKQHLYECIRQKLDTSGDTPYLAVFVDVKNFKIVNDIFSSEFGDLALQQIADRIRPEMTERCVYGRLAGDTFGVFVPADEFDSEQIERELTGFTVTDGTVEHHILIHLGVYEVTDKDTDDDVRSQTIIKNIIKLTDDLGIASLTEGVETQQQFISLAKMGCQLFQGYYFAKPMPVDEFEKFAFK